MRGTLIISLLLSLLAVLFALQNAAPIDVKLGPFEFNGSTAFVLLATFILGVVVGILATVPARFKSRLQLWRLKKDLRRKEQEPPEAAPTEEATPVLEARQEPLEEPGLLPEPGPEEAAPVKPASPDEKASS